MSVPHVEQFIDMLIGIPAEGYGNSFVYVMSEWTQKQGKYASQLLVLLFYRYVKVIMLFSWPHISNLHSIFFILSSLSLFSSDNF